jgi:hypothetical protein
MLEPIARAARVVRGAVAGDPGLLDSRSDERLHGGSQQPVLSREEQRSWGTGR